MKKKNLKSTAISKQPSSGKESGSPTEPLLSNN